MTDIPGGFKSLSQGAANPKQPVSGVVASLLLVLNLVFLNDEWGLLQRLEEPFGFASNSLGLLNSEGVFPVWKTMKKAGIKE